MMDWHRAWLRIKKQVRYAVGHNYTEWRITFRDVKKLKWYRTCKRCGLFEQTHTRPKKRWQT